MKNKLRGFLQAPPTPRELWTYFGMWAGAGSIIGFTSVIAHSFYLDISRDWFIGAASPFALCLLWWPVKQMLTCSNKEAFVVSIGVVFLSLGFYPTWEMHIISEWNLNLVFALIGIVISLPLYTEHIRLQQKKGMFD